jgi:hypothetical protein
MRLHHIILATLLIPTVGGCSVIVGPRNIGPEAPGQYSFRDSPPAEAAVFGGEAPRWGLAVSGGGMRSALFSLGVMKAMYDSLTLDNIEVLSTVSGGGYNAYWLYSRDYAAASQRFGEASFPTFEFKQGLCHIALHGNFVTNAAAARSLASHIRGPRRMYLESLHRTFGLDDTNPPLQLHQLRPKTRGLSSMEAAAPLPYLIINATQWRPEPVRGWAEGLYEMTPLIHGNDATGYAVWDSTSISLRQAVAVSGAAVRNRLWQRVNVDPRPSVVLADGGHSENLGAIALIRRGVKNIVVIDGSQDARYEFEDLFNLKTRMQQWGYALDVPDLNTAIERRTGQPNGPRFATSTFEGTVRGISPATASYQGRFIYVKLSIPASLDPILTDSMLVARGGEIYDTVFSRLEASERPDGNWDCAAIESITGSFDDFFGSVVSEYSEYNPEPFTVGRRARSNDFELSFPHMSTVLKQNMQLDVTVAFVGLGYLIGKTDLNPVMKRVHSAENHTHRQVQ